MKKISSSELVSLLFMVARSMRDSAQKNLAGPRHGSFLQFETLRYVKDNSHPFMSSVAKHFMITPPAATLLVDGLVKEKLLTRTLDPRDRRAVRVALTLDGQKFLAHGMNVRMKHLKQLFSVLSADERDQFANILKKIAKSRKI